MKASPDAYAERALNALYKEGIEIRGVKGTHCKTLAYDDAFYMNGSFNWLSAPRDEASKYHKREQHYRAALS